MLQLENNSLKLAASINIKYPSYKRIFKSNIIPLASPIVPTQITGHQKNAAHNNSAKTLPNAHPTTETATVPAAPV
jgi:hypothetical protein